ncbi:MAG: hypothetical protein JRN11_07310 [Nitrososphaerota archaeon]|nr:hypothetical protein [Nitrososphaerota archaeon]MDG7026538.1 hypothetical protein [Nitrososphaerota archaeon]
MSIIIITGAGSSGGSTLAYDLSQNEPINSTFDSIINARSIDQAVDYASRNRSTILFSVETQNFLQTEEYRKTCSGLARKLRDAKLKFIVVGTGIDKLAENESAQAKEKLQLFFPNEPVVLYSALPSLERSFSEGIAKTRTFAGVLRGLSAAPDARNILRSYFETPRQPTANEKQTQAELTKEVQKSDNVNEPEVDVEAFGVKVKAVGAVAYPAILAVSFLLVFLGVSQLASNIKGTDLEVVLNAAITVVALGVGLLVLYSIRGLVSGQAKQKPSHA